VPPFAPRRDTINTEEGGGRDTDPVQGEHRGFLALTCCCLGDRHPRRVGGCRLTRRDAEEREGREQAKLAGRACRPWSVPTRSFSLSLPERSPVPDSHFGDGFCIERISHLLEALGS